MIFTFFLKEIHHEDVHNWGDLALFMCHMSTHLSSISHPRAV